MADLADIVARQVEKQGWVWRAGMLYNARPRWQRVGEVGVTETQYRDPETGEVIGAREACRRFLMRQLTSCP